MNYELPEDLVALGREELLRLKNLIVEDARSIKQQLQAARSEAAATGLRADRRWYNSATTALRIKNAQEHRITAALGQLRREEKERNSERHVGAVVDDHMRHLHAFFQYAKRMLHPETFSAINSAAIRARLDLAPEATDCDRCGFAVLAEERRAQEEQGDG